MVAVEVVEQEPPVPPQLMMPVAVPPLVLVTVTDWPVLGSPVIELPLKVAMVPDVMAVTVWLPVVVGIVAVTVAPTIEVLIEPVTVVVLLLVFGVKVSVPDTVPTRPLVPSVTVLT